MISRVPYSALQSSAFTHVPAAYVSQLLRHVADLTEIKVTLLLFHLLGGTRQYPAYVAHSDVLSRAASLLGIDQPACTAALDAAVKRGVLLRVEQPAEPEGALVYFANIEADLDAIERFKSGYAPDGSGAGAAANVFELYEQNIGVITPIIAEELKDAQITYPAAWVDEAFREAVKRQKRNWKYISRILERWRVEGKGSGTNRSGAVQDDPDKYVKGRYGRIVRR